MRDLRDLAKHCHESGEDGGSYLVPSPLDGQVLRIIASNGGGWDHVSISRKNRAPNQIEMDYIYRLFFCEGETAIQYFLSRTEHINIHPHCLHLWRPQDETISKPPQGFV